MRGHRKQQLCLLIPLGPNAAMASAAVRPRRNPTERSMLAKAKWHKSVTTNRVMRGAERQMTSLDNPGFCLACGKLAGGCEPDAREYQCESCGEHQVYGAEELLMYMA